MKKIMICSGKGGVGKTTISVGLAKSLSRKGHKVALVDADIDGPNIPEFANVHEMIGTGAKLNPVMVDGMEVVSIGLILKDSDFVSWPSEKRGMAVQQLIEAVSWSDDIEYMVIDTPPGTSDEIEHVSSMFAPEIIFIVSTPHDASISDVKRTVSMIDNFKLDIAGIIMNMSRIQCHNCGEMIYEGDVPNDINGVKIVADIEYNYGNDIDKEFDHIADIVIGGK